MQSIHSEEYKQIIDKLIKARRNADLTQIEVSEKLNKPQSYISKVENCQRRLDAVELKHLAALYGIEASEIL